MQQGAAALVTTSKVKEDVIFPMKQLLVLAWHKANSASSLGWPPSSTRWISRHGAL